MLKCLVISDSSLPEQTLRVVSSALAIVRSSSKPGEVSVLVSGEKEAEDVARNSAKEVGRVILAKSGGSEERQSPELSAAVVAKLVSELGLTHVIAPATAFGRSVVPRVSGLLRAHAVSDVVGVEAPDTFSRPTSSGSKMATVRVRGGSVLLATVRASAFSRPDPRPPESAPAAIEKLAFVEELAKSLVDGGKIPRLEVAKGQQGGGSKRPPLSSARVVVSGGRGMKSKEGFSMIFALADSVGAAAGASRSAVDSEFCGHEIQVGQTGQTVNPEVYFAIGISGAVQHLAGMRDSKTIIAVNTDEKAPIFGECDFGLIADAAKVLPELTQLLSQKKK